MRVFSASEVRQLFVQTVHDAWNWLSLRLCWFEFLSASSPLQEENYKESAEMETIVSPDCVAHKRRPKVALEANKCYPLKRVLQNPSYAVRLSAFQSNTRWRCPGFERMRHCHNWNVGGVEKCRPEHARNVMQKSMSIRTLIRATSCHAKNAGPIWKSSDSILSN